MPFPKFSLAVLLCIAENAYLDQEAERERLTQEHYFKSSSEMKLLFGDLLEAYNNTIAHLRKSDSIATWSYDPSTGAIGYNGAPFAPLSVVHRVNETGGN